MLLRAGAALLLVVAIARLGFAWQAGLDSNRGDFYATLPGAYAQTWNPALWNSSEFAGNDAYQRSEYLYGPTQYLTIFPLLFFDTYDAIATVLLFVYLALIVLATWLMWRSFRQWPGVPASAGIAVIASTWLFLPLLQAYGQREFEVVILFATTCALYALLSKRDAIAGMLLGYAAWFKFFPLIFLPYFLLRRQYRAAAGFVAASVLLLGVTEAFLDLSRFAAVADLARTQATFTIAEEEFCEVWTQAETRHHALANHTRASVKWALCSLEYGWGLWPARWMHTAGLVIAFALGLFAHARLQRFALSDDDERWRRSLEVGLVLMAPWFLYAHYYYLAFAIVPLNALLVRYLGELAAGHACRRLWIWGAAYLLLSAFVVPPSVMTRILGTDYWTLYMRSNAYFFGEMLLLGMVLWEYFRLSSHPRLQEAPVAVPYPAPETRWQSLQPQI